jgi:hypothetical protein
VRVRQACTRTKRSGRPRSCFSFGSGHFERPVSNAMGFTEIGDRGRVHAVSARRDVQPDGPEGPSGGAGRDRIRHREARTRLAHPALPRLRGVLVSGGRRGHRALREASGPIDGGGQRPFGVASKSACPATSAAAATRSRVSAWQPRPPGPDSGKSTPDWGPSQESNVHSSRPSGSSSAGSQRGRKGGNRERTLVDTRDERRARAPRSSTAIRRRIVAVLLSASLSQAMTRRQIVPWQS